MAEYVRLRLAAAKVGASMALLALVAGVAEKAQAASHPAVAQTAANFLKLGGLTKTISYDFSKLEKKLVKLTNSVASLDAKFIKMNRNLSQNYYKAQSVDKIFLKTADANAKFLKADATAADSNKLGGVPASGFLHGKGAVLSNAASAVVGQQQVLLGDGSVRVLIGLGQAGQPSVTLENDTATTLNFTVVGGNPNGVSTIAPGKQVPITPTAPQLDIQMFGGGGGAGKVWTATISEIGQQFVGQMLIGLL